MFDEGERSLTEVASYYFESSEGRVAPRGRIPPVLRRLTAATFGRVSKLSKQPFLTVYKPPERKRSELMNNRAELSFNCLFARSLKQTARGCFTTTDGTGALVHAFLGLVAVN